MPKYILAERRHIADDLVAALERLHELDRALVGDRIATERDGLKPGDPP